MQLKVDFLIVTSQTFTTKITIEKQKNYDLKV